VCSEPKPTDFFVSTEGADHWSGKLPEANDELSDGPFATVGKARDAVRELKRTAAAAEPVTVWIRGGRYFLGEPLTFGPGDSGPVVYAAYPGETPVFDGGARVSCWRETELNGIDVWAADVSALLAEGAGCGQLFVNGERRPGARRPENGYFRMESLPDPVGPDGAPRTPALRRSFMVGPGDLAPADDLAQAELVLLDAWVAERFDIESYDPTGRVVTVCGEGSRRIKPGVRYYVANVPEALRKPGQWCLDAAAGQLYYAPMAGETPERTAAFVSCIPQFLRVDGDPDAERYVESITFRGLAFEHADQGGPVRSPQADCDVPGAIRLEGARCCTLADCRIEHAGWYGIELADGCTANRVVGCTLADLGAGGVKVGGADADGPRARLTGNNRITDNEVRAGGRIFHSAVGMLLMHSFGNEVSHNHIHDFFYSGISCGWSWGFGENVSRENRILKNHIHNIGQGVLADMGGIYMLGIQPGSTLRGNLIHDVSGESIAWGVYLDEGCSHILVEDNVCWDISHEAFHLHYGRENTVRNNIFAFAGNGLISITRGPEHDTRYAHCGPNSRCSFTLERNILIADGCPLLFKYVATDGGLEDRPFRSDMNLGWDVSGKTPLWAGAGFRPHGGGFEKTYDLEAWRALGNDLFAEIADPLCADLAGRDFTLAPESPAFALGFRPIDTRDVGPRPRTG